MKQAEYKLTQDLLLTYAQSLSACFENLPEFIEAIDRADTFGPMLDPTLWMKGHKNMEHIKTIAEALQKARGEVKPALEKLQGNLNNKEV